MGRKKAEKSNVPNNKILNANEISACNQEGKKVSRKRTMKQNQVEKKAKIVVECAICLGSPRGANAAKPSGCNHYFCIKCLTDWAKKHDTCPMDRVKFQFVDIANKTTGELVRRKDRNGKQQPLPAQTEVPSALPHLPLATPTLPAAPTQQPGATSQLPAAPTQQPGVISQLPAASTQQPGATSQLPAASTRQLSAAAARLPTLPTQNLPPTSQVRTASTQQRATLQLQVAPIQQPGAIPQLQAAPNHSSATAPQLPTSSTQLLESAHLLLQLRAGHNLPRTAAPQSGATSQVRTASPQRLTVTSRLQVLPAQQPGSIPQLPAIPTPQPISSVPQLPTSSIQHPSSTSQVSASSTQQPRASLQLRVASAQQSGATSNVRTAYARQPSGFVTQLSTTSAQPLASTVQLRVTPTLTRTPVQQPGETSQLSTASTQQLIVTPQLQVAPATPTRQPSTAALQLPTSSTQHLASTSSTIQYIPGLTRTPVQKPGATSQVRTPTQPRAIHQVRLAPAQQLESIPQLQAAHQPSAAITQLPGSSIQQSGTTLQLNLVSTPQSGATLQLPTHHSTFQQPIPAFQIQIGTPQRLSATSQQPSATLQTPIPTIQLPLTSFPEQPITLQIVMPSPKPGKRKRSWSQGDRFSDF